VDETLVGVARCLHLLQKGASIQHYSVLDGLPRLLQSEGAAACVPVFDVIAQQCCTWQTELQMHAADTYNRLIQDAKPPSAAPIQPIEAEMEPPRTPSAAGTAAAQTGLLDTACIEQHLLPTILLMADSEGSDAQEEVSQRWLEPLFAALDLLTHECRSQRVLLFAMHKAEPGAATASRAAAAKIMAKLAGYMEAEQVEQMVASHILPLSQDPAAKVRLSLCKHLPALVRGMMGFSSAPLDPLSPLPLSPPPSPSSTSLFLLHKLVEQLEQMVLTPAPSFDSLLCTCRSEAMQCMVDISPFMPGQMRKQRMIPLWVKLYAEASTTSESSSRATQEQQLLLQSMLMRSFGPFLWQMRADLSAVSDCSPSSSNHSSPFNRPFNRMAKNDQERVGHERLIAEKEEETEWCVVRRMRRYLRGRRDKEEPLFPTARGGEMSPDTPRGRLKIWLELIGVEEITEYGFHSLRAAGATDAARAGAEEREIKAHGNWKSDAVKLYIRQNTRDRLKVSKLLGSG
jgi:hypothetical protein